MNEEKITSFNFNNNNNGKSISTGDFNGLLENSFNAGISNACGLTREDFARIQSKERQKTPQKNKYKNYTQEK